MVGHASRRHRRGGYVPSILDYLLIVIIAFIIAGLIGLLTWALA